MAAANPQLEKVQSVYILSMGSGMDQYLANQLTTMGIFQVVADPEKADTVLTDHLGQSFEDKMKELYPPPPVPKKADDKDKDKDSKDNLQAYQPLVQTSLGSGKGNFFLVDRRTRAVVWSIYERPKNTSADELSKTAVKVVKRLKKDLEPPKQSPAR